MDTDPSIKTLGANKSPVKVLVAGVMGLHRDVDYP